MKIAVVYVATNTTNGKQYVGVTRLSAAKRWAQHCTRARSNVRTRLYAAIKKYGAESFSLSEVASCITDPGGVERDVIAALQPAYNQTNGGEHTVGRRVPPETSALVADKIRGTIRTPEQRARMSASAKQRHARSEERRAFRNQLAEARSKIDRSKQSEAAAKAGRERVWTDASRAKLSASCKGRPPSEKGIATRRAQLEKRVRCVETGEIYPSCLKASAALGINHGGIGRVANGKLRTAGGLTFEWA